MPAAPDDRERRVRAHVEAFNAAVTSGDWAIFAARFAESARLVFTNAPVSPSSGREAILAVYEAQPPDETLRVLEVSVDPADPGVDVVRFAWASGEPGTMRFRWAGDLVAELAVTFG